MSNKTLGATVACLLATLAERNQLVFSVADPQFFAGGQHAVLLRGLSPQ